MRVLPVPETLSGAGLVLARYRRGDAAAVHEAVVESGSDLSRFETWAHAPYTLEDAAAYVGWWIDGWQDGSAYYFGIWREDLYLGSCGVAGVNRAHRLAGLGFWVRTSETRRGVATAASRLVVGFCFDHLGLDRVEVLASVKNTASRRVAAKIGAVEEGVLRSRLVLGGMAHDAALSAVVHT